jgi:hypothetical protein
VQIRTIKYWFILAELLHRIRSYVRKIVSLAIIIECSPHFRLSLELNRQTTKEVNFCASNTLLFSKLLQFTLCLLTELIVLDVVRGAHAFLVIIDEETILTNFHDLKIRHSFRLSSTSI